MAQEKKESKKAKEKIAKKNVKATKSKVKKENYLKQTRKELKLVKWPTKKEVAKYTGSTIIFCLFICGFFLLLNLLLTIVKGTIG